jgi:catechol 2,3-dioxygenase-like lactoylglutathione lyase family enzyme
MTSATLDHVVINARDELDEACAIYSRLGFNLTERGYHKSGSMLHLAIFGTDYLELYACPAAAPRPGVTCWTIRRD